MRNVLVGSLMLIACNNAVAPKSKSEPLRSVAPSLNGQRCTAAIDEVEARLLHERDTGHVLGAIGKQLYSSDYKLPEVIAAATIFEPGIVLGVESANAQDGALVDALQHGPKNEPVRVYVHAPATLAPAALAEIVAALAALVAAHNRTLDFRLLVGLPQQIQPEPWPDATPPDIRRWAEQMMESPGDAALLEQLRDRLHRATASCSVIAQRTERAFQAAEHDIGLTGVAELRRCGCRDMDVPLLGVLFHALEFTGTYNGWIRISTTTGTPARASSTIGEAFASVRADATTTLRITAARVGSR
jgi:hypothetical protein